MKGIIITSIFAFILSLNTKAQNIAYKVDEEQSTVKWKGYAGVGSYAPVGTIKIKSGNIKCAGNFIRNGFVLIDMTTIENENKDLEGHLKNEDFFDCKKYPTAKFDLITLKGKNAVGKLTIKGIAKEVKFPMTYNNLNGKLTIKANLKVDRTLYNIKYNSASYFQDLGNYAIKNEFDLEIVLVASTIK